MVTESDILRVMETAEDFPALSAAAMQIAQMTADIQAPVSKVAKLIMMDVGLSTKLLRVVNSSFYGLSDTVSEIAQAVSILGYKKVGSLALGLSVMETFSGPMAGGFDLKLFWERSVCNAVSAGLIAARLRRDIPGEIFTTGLLQDIGCLFLAQYFPLEYGAAIGTSKARNAHPAVVEREVVGIDHAAVGAILARRWKFPPIFEETIREHHFAEFGTDVSASSIADLIRVINLSSLFTNVFYEEDKQARIILLQERAQELFRFGEKSIQIILEQVPAEMEEAASTFEMTIRLKPPPKKSADRQPAPVETLPECPRCGAKGLGKFCVECGASLIKRSSQELNKRILIAEDSAATRRALAFVIKKLGYEVVEAIDGTEVLKLARTHQPGLILLDIMMPVLNGLQVLKVLREESAIANIPIVMLTSLTDSTTVIEAIKSGANDYIVKPYSAETIVDRVKKYMETSLAPSV